jgi:hypothetical protein
MEGKSYQALRELPGFAGFHGGFTPEGGEDWPQVKERTAQFMKVCDKLFGLNKSVV